MLYKIQSKGNNFKTEQSRITVCEQPFKSLQETCILSLESFGPMVVKKLSGQGNPDAAHESNPYMSASQATQKLDFNLN